MHAFSARRSRGRWFRRCALLTLAATAAVATPARANPADLDPLLGGTGVVTTDLGGNEIGSAVRVQPDGKIVVVGDAVPAGTSTPAATVNRYRQDGSPDGTFATGGVFQLPGPPRSLARALAIQRDGKIVVAGLRGTDFLVFRLDTLGNLDPTFGGGGVVTTGLWGLDHAEAVALQTDGKIVVAGEAETPTGADIAVARYEATGGLDGTFGMGGVVTTDPTGVALDEEAFGLAIQPDGKLVVVGDSGANPDTDIFVVRYGPGGNLDPTFGSGGIVLVDTRPGDPDDYAYDVALQGSRIIVGGYTFDQAKSLGLQLLLGLRPNGALDPTFGPAGTGIVLTDVGSSEGFEFDEDLGLELQCDGKIVVGGPRKGTAFGIGNGVVVRYERNGFLDATFGAGGIVSPTFAPVGEEAFLDLALDPGGRIVVTGYAYNTQPGHADDVGVARLVGSGGCLGEHYLCHKSRTTRGTSPVTPILSVDLADQFYDQTFRARRPRYVCPPADKRGEGIVDPDVSLVSYTLDYLPGDPRHKTQFVQVTTQFGTVTGTLYGPNSLMVPSAVDLATPPAPPAAGHAVDHYKCYCFKASSPQLDGVPIADLFTPAGKPHRVRPIHHVCTPVDKNGEGITDPAHHLACFRVRPDRPIVDARGVFLANQFGSEVRDVGKAVELCLPARKTVLPPPPGVVPRAVGICRN